MKLCLIILDGFGIREEEKNNAIRLAKTRNFDRIFKKYPHTELSASGIDVGLPPKTIGNSEVGHMNIGAGRVVKQEVARISDAIRDKSFFRNKKLLDAVDYAKKNNSALHLIGLASDASVHSHISHLFALIDLAGKHDLNKIYVHFVSDGRDVEPFSAKKYLSMLEKKIGNKKDAKIATVIGRYYAMDRDKRWDRTEKAFNAIANGIGKSANNASAAINNSYRQRKGDEFIDASVINRYFGISRNDSIVLFDFRSDRMRQITAKLMSLIKERKIKITCFCEYDKNFGLPVAFPPLEIKNSLGEIFSKKGFRQLRIAETEKYAHVTYFFNCGREKPFAGESRILIPSPKIATYDLKPEMSAYEATAALLKNIAKYDIVVMNFANPDMVGHTGKLRKTIKAVETTDYCIGKIVRKVKELKGTAVITADHGNAEEEAGKYQTSHTLNKVPFVIIDGKYKLRKGRLADAAPTMLELLKVKKPKEMNGESLILRN